MSTVPSRIRVCRVAPRVARVLLASLALAALACDDTTAPVQDPEPEVASMRLTVGTQTVTFNGATVTGAPILLKVGTPTTVSAVWLKADGSVDAVASSASKFELKVVPAASSVSYTKTSAFAGTLSGSAATSTSATFALFHLAEQHEDFGPVSIAITVSP